MSEATAVAPRPQIRSRTFATLVDNADYRRFYIGQGISLVGTWVQEAAVNWLVYEMTGSAWWLGVVSAAGTLPGLFVGLYAGALADRVAPKTMILLMQIGQMVMAFSLAFLVWTGVVQIWQMLIILAVTRICVTFEMPSRQVFLYDLVGKGSITNAIALNSGLFNASKVIGPALMAICFATLGPTACFTLNGLSYLGAIAALLMIHRPHKKIVATQESSGGILGGLKYLRQDRKLASLFAGMILFGVVGMGYSALMSAYAKGVLGATVKGFSVLMAASGLGATAGALLLASVGGFRRKHLLILGGMALFGASLATAGGLPPLLLRHDMKTAAFVVATLAMFGAGVGALVFYAATQTQIQLKAPDALRGRIMGVWMIAFSGSVPLGSLWAGALARIYGVAPVMVASAIACLAVGLGGMLVSVFLAATPRSSSGSGHTPS